MRANERTINLPIEQINLRHLKLLRPMVFYVHPNVFPICFKLLPMVVCQQRRPSQSLPTVCTDFCPCLFERDCPLLGNGTPLNGSFLEQSNSSLQSYPSDDLSFHPLFSQGKNRCFSFARSTTFSRFNNQQFVIFIQWNSNSRR